MSEVRKFWPGDSVLTRRRTMGGRLLLLPDEDCTQMARYCMATGVRASGVHIYSACWLPNEKFEVLCDPRPRRDKYHEITNGNFAKCRNRQLSEMRRNPWGIRRGRLWDGRQFDDTRLRDADAVIEAIVATCLRPVAAGIVDHPDEYKGPIILPRHWDEPFKAKRPKWYFSRYRKEELAFRPLIPWPLHLLDKTVAIDLVRELIDEGAAEIRAMREANKRPPPLGMDGLLSLRPWDYPAVQPPPPRRGRPPKELQENPNIHHTDIHLQAATAGVSIAVKVAVPVEYPLVDGPYAPESAPSAEDAREPAGAYHLMTTDAAEATGANHDPDETIPRHYPLMEPVLYNPPKDYSRDPAIVRAERLDRRRHVRWHEAARQAFRDGERDVIFPPGTVKMRHNCGVNCARAP